MDFIERLLQVSPDGGSGAAEATLFIALMLGVVVAALRRRRSPRGGTGRAE